MEPLEDYPEWQTFEIGMLDGCAAGYLSVDGDSNTYFYDVYQPVRFIAADSLESDSGVVKLRVGLVEGGIIGKTSSSNNPTPPGTMR